MFNIFKRRKGKQSAAIPERKSYGSYQLQPGSFLEYAAGNAAGLPGYTNLTAYQAMQFYRQTSPVATAVDLRAEEIQQLKIVLKLPDGTLTDKHEIIQKLKRPNDFEEQSSFIGQLARHFLITNNCYFYASGLVNRPPLELYAAKPTDVSVQEGQNRYPSHYVIGQGAATGSYTLDRSSKLGARFYDAKQRELYQVSGFSSLSSNLTGDSPLLACTLEVMQYLKGRNHNLSLLNNGGRLSLLVHLKDTYDHDTHKERKQEIQESWGGDANAGSIGVISSGDMEVHELGMHNKDMDFAKLDEVIKHAIYLRYKIPLPLVSTDASTYNNYETAVESLYDNGVLPTAQTLFSGLSMMLLPRYGLDPLKYNLTYDPETIPALMARRIDQIRKRKETGIETINELRESLPNREDVKHGDVIYQPATLVPLGSDGETGPEELTEEDIDNLIEE